MQKRTTVSLLIMLACCAAVSGLFGQDRGSTAFKRKVEYRPPMTLERGPSLDEQLMETFILMQKASAGEPLAENELGLRLLLGKGFAPDSTKAAYWIERAAIHKLPIGQFNYGILKYHGWGTPWDPFMSFIYLRRAADQEMLNAMYVLALLYTENFVVPRDLHKAYEWMKKAADLGHQDAKTALKQLEAMGANETPKGAPSRDTLVKVYEPVLMNFTSEGTKQEEETNTLRSLLNDERFAGTNVMGKRPASKDSLTLDSTIVGVVQKAAENGSPEALAVLGRCYERGTVVRTDQIAAASYYIRAIRLESRHAYQMMVKLASDEKFRRHLDSLVAAGEAEAQFVWAGMSNIGLEYRMQGKQVVTVLEKLASKGHREACYEAGLCYFWGRGVEQNRRRALELWKRADSLGSREAHIRVAAMVVIETRDTTERAEAWKILADAEEEGSLTAELTLAYCYETGTAVGKQIPEAVRRYRRAFYRGSRSAYNALRKLHDALRPSEPEFKIKDDETME